MSRAPSAIPEVEPNPEDQILSDISYERVLANAGVYRKGGLLLRRVPAVMPPSYFIGEDGRRKKTIHYAERPVAMSLADARIQKADFYHPGGPLNGRAEVGPGWYRYGLKRELDYPENAGTPKTPYLEDTEDAEDDPAAPPRSALLPAAVEVMAEEVPDHE